MDKFIVSRDDSIYEAFPDLVLLPSGKLICVFLECKHHSDRSYSRVVFTESLDRGRTWQQKKPLSEISSGWNCPRISFLKDGRVVIICDKGAGEKEIKKRKLYMWYSWDEGKSWSKEIELPIPGFVPDKLKEIKSDRWLIATQRYNEKKFLEQMLYISDNKGKKWEGPICIASKEGLNLCEGSILELPNGELVCFMRENSFIGLDCFKAISYDNGNTWEGPYPFPIPGCHRPVSGILKSGYILITHRFCQGGKGWLGWWTQNFFASLTDIESALAKERNQAHTRIKPIDYDRSKFSDTGYSGWVQFPDGEIYIVNYIVDDAPNGHIRGYSIREDEFII
ncbi:MAG: glycoside hydrolase [Candidatus Omnitrophica bacterium]|nr:glycoside hydrolase [Candidatus Omnitrophota bacterium]MCM8802091.1 glycoside hydrolase [Candidatus Omnitrophota bacterium]